MNRGFGAGVSESDPDRVHRGIDALGKQGIACLLDVGFVDASSCHDNGTRVFRTDIVLLYYMVSKCLLRLLLAPFMYLDNMQLSDVISFSAPFLAYLWRNRRCARNAGLHDGQV
jgi:hypothetical protein